MQLIIERAAACLVKPSLAKAWMRISTCIVVMACCAVLSCERLPARPMDEFDTPKAEEQSRSASSDVSTISQPTTERSLAGDVTAEDDSATAQVAADGSVEGAKLEMLRELSRRKSAVRQKMSVMPQKVEEQTVAIMRAMDDFWKSDTARTVHDGFMKDAERIAGDVALDDEYSSLDTFWAEYKSLINDDLLNKMADAYITKLFDALKPTADGLADRYKQPMDDALAKAFTEAQQNLASEFDQSLRDQFPKWPQCFTSLPLPSIDTPQTDAPGESVVGRRPFAKFGLALVLAPIIARIVKSMVGKVVTRASRKVATKVTTKIAGKVAGKLIPFIGWALLAYDVVDAATARSRFEDAIRKEVLIELGEETKPEAIWQSGGDDGPTARSEAEVSIRRQLDAYKDQMQSLTNEFLEVASLVDTPAFKKFVTSLEGHTTDGKPDPLDIGHLVNRCKAISNAFGPLCATVDDFDILEEMVLTAPDKRSLRSLSDLLGEKIVPLYKQHRGALMDAAALLGPRNLADMIARDRDWRSIVEEYRHLLGTSPTEAQRRGLLLALEHQFNVKNFSNPELLERIAKRAELFESLANGGVEQSRTVDLIMHDDASSFLDDIRSGDGNLIAPFAKDIPVSRLRRMGDDGQSKTVLAIWTIARERGVDASSFASEIAESEDLFATHRDHGKDGVAIWLAHAGDAPGSTQRRRAKQALSLHADGCPLQVCLDGDNLALTSWFYSFPVIGPTVHSWLYPLLARAPWLGWLMLLAAMAFIAAIGWRLIRVVMWPGNRRQTVSRRRGGSAFPRPVVIDHHTPPPTRSLPPTLRNPDGDVSGGDK